MSQASGKWFPSRVVRLWEEGRAAVGVAVQPTEEWSSTHRAAGQYVEVRLGASIDTSLAIASAPGRPVEFLVRRDAKLAELLRSHEAAAVAPPLELSGALGDGFVVDGCVGRNLFLIGTGTGLAPLRALAQRVIEQRALFRNVNGLLGVRASADVAFAREIQMWRALGIDLQLTLSQAHASWAGRRGYVQEHLSPALVPGTVFFVCGQDEMVAAVRSQLLALGADRTDVRTNWP